MLKQPSEAFFKKDVMGNFAEFPRKHLCRNLFFAVVNFAKFVRTTFLQNSTGRLLLIIAVSIVVKGVLANETVNYDTKALRKKCPNIKSSYSVRIQENTDQKKLRISTLLMQ